MLGLITYALTGQVVAAGLTLPRIITLIVSLTCASESAGIRIAAFIVWLVTAFIILGFGIVAYNFVKNESIAQCGKKETGKEECLEGVDAFLNFYVFFFFVFTLIDFYFVSQVYRYWQSLNSEKEEKSKK